MTFPRIGITTSFNDGVQNINHTYIQAIEAAGGLPMIVPMLKNDAMAHEFSALLDGLVITGGPGITQGLVGELPTDLDPVDPVRYTSDTLIYNTFQDTRPILGICYGMQFLNAQAGGNIYGDVSKHIETDIQHSSGRGGTTHPVNLVAGSRLSNIFGTEQITANTYHLQALASVANNFTVSATSPDGVIEGIESADGRLIGVQFHPERMTDITAPLFADFVNRCRA
jgi:putative glutamine amidotransferase